MRQADRPPYLSPQLTHHRRTGQVAMVTIEHDDTNEALSADPTPELTASWPWPTLTLDYRNGKTVPRDTLAAALHRATGQPPPRTGDHPTRSFEMYMRWLGGRWPYTATGIAVVELSATRPQGFEGTRTKQPLTDRETALAQLARILKYRIMQRGQATKRAQHAFMQAMGGTMHLLVVDGSGDELNPSNLCLWQRVDDAFLAHMAAGDVESLLFRAELRPFGELYERLTQPAPALAPVIGPTPRGPHGWLHALRTTAERTFGMG